MANGSLRTHVTDRKYAIKRPHFSQQQQQQRELHLFRSQHVTLALSIYGRFDVIHAGKTASLVMRRPRVKLTCTLITFDAYEQSRS